MAKLFVNDNRSSFANRSYIASKREKSTSRKQAIAIGLSEARRDGAKVPRKRSSKKEGSTEKERNEEINTE